MVDSPDRRTLVDRYPPGWLRIIGMSAVAVAGWVVAGTGLVGVVSFMPELGWRQVVYLVVLCGAPPLAVLAVRRAQLLRRIQAAVPAPLLGRVHGSLDAIGEDEGRPLRPIGSTAQDVAWRTGSLLAKLTSIPGVRIFHGVRMPGWNTPLVAHVVAAGRTMILVESVAWPPGDYRIDTLDRISCDGLYIGQSINALRTAVRQWRAALPHRHRIHAVIVVHPTGDCPPSLPGSPGPDLTWIGADHALSVLGQRVPYRKNISTHAMAALLAATSGAEFLNYSEW